MEETWKDIPNYEGLYQISSSGKVKSLARTVSSSLNNGHKRVLKERILKGTANSWGYLMVSLYKNKKVKIVKIHILMASVFMGKRPLGKEGSLVIDHIDSKKDNNNLSNLRYISHRENISRSRNKGKSQYTGIYWVEKRQKWCARIQIKGIRKHLGYFCNEFEAHESYQKEFFLI